MSDDNESDNNIIKRTCAGRCGAVLRYRLGPYREGYTQELTCLDGGTAYRGGHLCRCCDVAVAEALAARRGRPPKTGASERAARTAPVRARRGEAVTRSADRTAARREARKRRAELRLFTASWRYAAAFDARTRAPVLASPSTAELPEVPSVVELFAELELTVRTIPDATIRALLEAAQREEAFVLAVPGADGAWSVVGASYGALF